MSLLTQQMAGYLERASWIRKMFEEGARLKAEHGVEAVCDFSLGNPDLPPPGEVKKALGELAELADQPLSLGYMPNPGYPWVRQALAEMASKEQAVTVAPEDIIITCGAAGALNVLFRAVLEPGEEVLSPAPFFVEYGFYTENHGGVFKTAPVSGADFSLDLNAMEQAITAKTRVVLINSPNNPTGRVYSREELEALAQVLEAKSKEHGKPIFLVSDEPYRFLTFDSVEVPSLLSIYPYSVVGTSFSKNLSMAGERVGYLLVNPSMQGKDELIEGLVLANRILGFVNAPAIGQAVAAKALNSQVDVSIYANRRAAMAEVLDNASIDYFMPQGAFYFFPKAPGGDDVAFCAKLQQELILAVPGRGFGFPGYFRLTFCVDEAVIRRSAEGFKRATA
ncbi:MAG: pyridoxal phosphate-dependent aminotransferase [Desulfovibrio sp.]|nr:MAG: pyridoxal phosphate-dependent aminotransferase [Desulfovibrio sp.]